ncbi:MAG: (d)CMP kinase [Ruminococcaceae bacterium]|nr:(d)CMP kinase [Oscillospiraceae bacterium]
MKKINIAIDGPSGAGKSSLAKKVAKELDIIYVDTGALYRTIGYYAKQKGLTFENITEVVDLLDEIKLDLCYKEGVQAVILNGDDVSDHIRTSEISMYASAVSAIPEVRSFLLDTQRDIAKEHSVIMDGRDIATVVLPDADVKIFLTADPKKRAERRYEELKAKNPDISFESVYNDMVTRDKNDSTRAVAPAIKAEDAILLDNTTLSEEESVKEALRIIFEKVGKYEVL